MISERDELIDIDKNEIAISKHPEIPSEKIKRFNKYYY